MTMDAEEFEQICSRQIAQSLEVLVKKAGEYAHPEDRLRNFRIGSVLTSETPEQVVWGFAVKHIVSISEMVQSGEEFTKGQWDEKIGDAINYLILLRAQIFETAMEQTTVNPGSLDSLLANGVQNPTRPQTRRNVDNYGNTYP